MKYCRLGSINNRNVFPYNFGGWKPEIKGMAGLESHEISLLGLRMVTSLAVSSYVTYSVHTCVCV